MTIKYHVKFEKAYKKRIASNLKLKLIVRDKIKLFTLNPKHPLLRNHRLKGDKKDKRAFHITGDIRIVYKQITDNLVLFLDIGTHNQVY